ncbi:ubiquitin carboxyl-terminal hydrolase 1-like [Mytilus edulis]|uniref:ubiquitin carboxyl-terminal hydrolase 1-like n=1 Tax=Mytilus edulis TaxID=6550 RepID=UPI0039EED081
MVVADADSPGPVRKRAKLSLKFLKRGSTDSTTNTPTSVSEKKEPLIAREVSDDITEKNVSFDGDTSITESSVVPAVSSLENLGNTCFLNSVLQILRFTPRFLDRLDDLYQELVQTEKLQKQDKQLKGDEDEDYKTPQTCELVKYLYKLYRTMERQEEKHHDIATEDVMSMAIKPEKILGAIRELNPMFEGSLQHDAQELLRCILCYLQDAEKEILKLKNSIQPVKLPNTNKLMNPIMQSFISAGKEEKSKRDCSISHSENISQDLFHKPFISTEENCNKTDLLEQIDESESAMTGGSVEIISPEKVPECQIADIPLETKGSDCISIKRQRKKNSMVNGNSENIMCDGKENGVVCISDISGENDSQKDNQLSIMAMLKGSASCKRLGMRGAVLKNRMNINNSNNTEEHLMSNQERELLSCIDGVHGTEYTMETNENSSPETNSFNGENFKERASPSKYSCIRKPLLSNGLSDAKISPLSEGSFNLKNSPMKNGLLNLKNSPLKNGMPVVKLENCDHVCDSPKKSVSAAYATQTLTPTHSPKNRVLSAMAKLDFSDQNNTSTKKKDFVEKLFMGTLMLRTKCTECEFSREKIEEFHDISVAVRKENIETSDDEDDAKEENCQSDDEEDDKDPSLPKLLESFCEVERLKGDNKYFCDKCQHHVEAERSLHYNVLPDVLSVHLKRFSTASGIFGYMSKINDHVRIPLSLPCLRHKCPSPCSRSDHRYRLYGLIAHAGVTLTSGHYLTYVRVFHSVQESSGSQEYSSPSTSKSPALNRSTLTSYNSQSQRALSESPRGDNLSKFVKIPSQKYEDCWLQCDDESVKVYSEEKFCSMLQDGSLLGTPYVLFYHKQNRVKIS